MLICLSLLIFWAISCHGLALPERLIDQIAMESFIMENSTNPDRRNVGFKVNPFCQCGVASKDAPNSHPWTAAIFYKYRETPQSKGTLVLFCAGSLINDRYVVTASRCVQGLAAADLQVWLSDKKVWSDQPTSEDLGLHKSFVSKVTIHPDFDPSTLNHEIALLQLSSPVQISPPFQQSAEEQQQPGHIYSPVCLPKYDVMSDSTSDKAGKLSYKALKGTVVSWDKKGRTSYFLAETGVPIVNGVDECVKMSNETAVINENMLCAGNMEQGAQESCSMDTGSPLVLYENAAKPSRSKREGVSLPSKTLESSNGHFTLIGISSWLYGCTNLDNVSLLYDVIFPNNTAKPQVPGVYTRVERYRDWITHNTLDAVWCA